MSQAGLVVYNADEMEPTKIVYYSGEDELKPDTACATNTMRPFMPRIVNSPEAFKS